MIDSWSFKFLGVGGDVGWLRELCQVEPRGLEATTGCGRKL